jgi:hypothetical protein
MTTRTHRFPQNNDVIYTTELPNGKFLAFINHDADYNKEGWGSTRLEAVSDYLQQHSPFFADFIELPEA